MSFGYSLAVCPVCTARTGPVRRPEWYPAKRSSVARKERCQILFGCRHSELVTKLKACTAGEAPACEALWIAEASRLFTERTAHWTEAERVSFALALGRNEAPPELDLTAEEQAEIEPPSVMPIPDFSQL